ncbi:hypothetical protein LTR36_001178 [Oleoguttula mirabilis]|uniref:Uncharacterized protein n=1 Tax=Oleoguttula mirabilis TaxID=1507867 RepID=A0AAV9J3Q4_9PEZI|nr:hypothetical protein LTR36_001178 [Oleoguttula mirabilis]
MADGKRPAPPFWLDDLRPSHRQRIADEFNDPSLLHPTTTTYNWSAVPPQQAPGYRHFMSSMSHPQGNQNFEAGNWTQDTTSLPTTFEGRTTSGTSNASGSRPYPYQEVVASIEGPALPQQPPINQVGRAPEGMLRELAIHSQLSPASQLARAGHLRLSTASRDRFLEANILYVPNDSEWLQQPSGASGLPQQTPGEPIDSESFNSSPGSASMLPPPNSQQAQTERNYNIATGGPSNPKARSTEHVPFPPLENYTSNYPASTRESLESTFAQPGSSVPHIKIEPASKSPPPISQKAPTDQIDFQAGVLTHSGIWMELHFRNINIQAAQELDAPVDPEEPLSLESSRLSHVFAVLHHAENLSSPLPLTEIADGEQLNMANIINVHSSANQARQHAWYFFLKRLAGVGILWNSNSTEWVYDEQGVLRFDWCGLQFRDPANAMAVQGRPTHREVVKVVKVEFGRMAGG